MTATAINDYRDMRSVESKKQRYSRELAEYTHRQWDTARQAMESEKAKDDKKSSSRRSSSSSKDQIKSSRTSQGIQAIDYASRSHSGGGFELQGRALMAGNV